MRVNTRTGLIVGLSGVLLYGLTYLLMARAQRAAKCRKVNWHIDTSSEDSFPASDPPSFTPAAAT